MTATVTVETLLSRVDAEPVAVRVEYAPTRVVKVSTPGPQGPPGPTADLNALLAAVDDAVQDYLVLHPRSWTYDQTSAVYHWSIVHPLDHRPQVVVTDSAGTEYEGEVNWPAVNVVTVDFNVPLAGRATLT